MIESPPIEDNIELEFISKEEENLAVKYILLENGENVEELPQDSLMNDDDEDVEGNSPEERADEIAVSRDNDEELTQEQLMKEADEDVEGKFPEERADEFAVSGDNDEELLQKQLIKEVDEDFEGKHPEEREEDFAITGDKDEESGQNQVMEHVDKEISEDRLTIERPIVIALFNKKPELSLIFWKS